jgi:glycosyltransferase involved in cell wall biosynthesis
MKIVFFYPNLAHERSEKFTYESVQKGSGFSGSETALIEIATYLSKAGHKVYIIGMSDVTYMTHGVTVCRHTIVEDDDFCYDIDIFCPLFVTHLYITDYILSKLNPNVTKIWLWLQLFVHEKYINILREDGFKVIASFLAPYVRDKYDLSLFHSHVTIGNAIGPIFMTPIKGSNRKGNWVFHASYERGGEVAMRIMERAHTIMPESAKLLHYASYYTPDHQKQVQGSGKCNTVYHGSLSKIGVSSLLSQCDYFIYPLVHNNGTVHHDTYGSVMLEALARGVIVITWNVACIPSVYSDYVVKIDPKCVGGYEPFARFGENKWMLSDEAIGMFVEKIRELEENPDEKERLRANGIAWAHTQTWEDRGGAYNKWIREMV